MTNCLTAVSISYNGVVTNPVKEHIAPPWLCPDCGEFCVTEQCGSCFRCQPLEANLVVDMETGTIIPHGAQNFPAVGKNWTVNPAFKIALLLIKICLATLLFGMISSLFRN